VVRLMRFCEIAVDVPNTYSQTFSYSIPSSMSLLPGQLVRVPFGPRVVQGIVFLLTTYAQVDYVKSIASIEHGEPLLDDSRLDLARWLSHHYLSSLFEAASLMFPPGVHRKTKLYFSLSDGVVVPTESGIVLQTLDERILNYISSRGTVEESRLSKALDIRVTTSLARLMRLGLVTRTAFWEGPRVRPKYENYIALATNYQFGEEAIASLERRAPKQAELLKALLDSDGHRLSMTQVASDAARALIAKGMVERSRVRVERSPFVNQAVIQTAHLSLTMAQQRAVREIEESMDGQPGRSKAFLLHGVTGSGKTEVYLQALAKCIALGRRAIVLIPEISMTHQAVERFNSRFPGRVAVLHSRLSPGQQFDQWWGVNNGDYDVVIGSRSGIFAPQAKLGLIVIDEEHEWTYKEQDRAPRYHDREVALELASLTGATLVMGSATPDVVTYSHAIKGAYKLLELTQRVGPSLGGGMTSPSMPKVELVDMRKELKDGNRNLFSRVLVQAMEKTLYNEEQAIIFLNRRGSASVVQCRDCGFALHCQRCEVALTYHSSTERVVCHQCNHNSPLPRKCPKCGGLRIRYLGLGTQRVVQEMSARFPEARLLRWDSDSTHSLNAQSGIIEQFMSGDADILVGTQLVAKGLDLPRVTLVGIICADMGLHIPDFRAGERAFQLLCQVAGRAGRRDREGKAIIQTYSPTNYAIVAAANQDYGLFYKQEMEFRLNHGNPPFSRLAHIVYTHSNVASCQREAQRVGLALLKERDLRGLRHTTIIGPAPAFPSRVRGRYRWHMVIRSPDPLELLGSVYLPSGWTLDVDPVSVL
jgi:primosomal protein N' (replication factor Y)